MVQGLSLKLYLQLTPPTEEDSRSCQQRILDALLAEGIFARLSAAVLRSLYPVCGEADWKVTVSLAWDGLQWVAVKLEKGARLSARSRISCLSQPLTQTEILQWVIIVIYCMSFFIIECNVP